MYSYKGLLLPQTDCIAGSVMQKHYSSHSLLSWCKVVISHIAYVPKSACTCCADDLDDVADSVLPGGKDTVSICLITGFESFNISLYTKVHCISNQYNHYLVHGITFRYLTA